MRKILTYMIIMSAYMVFGQNNNPVFQENVLSNKQRLDYVINFSWHETEWLEEEKYEYGYNTSGEVILQMFSEWEDGSWKKKNKNEYTYNPEGDELQDIYSYWTGTDWHKYVKNENIYDADGNLHQKINSEWWNSTWEYQYKDEYTYDNDGNMILDIFYDWGNEQWLLNEKYEYSYDENSRLSEMISSRYTDSTWKYRNKKSYAYYTDGNLMQKVLWVWAGNDWVYDNKFEYLYNESDSLIKKISYQRLGNEWSELQRAEYIFNSEGKKTQTLHWYKTTDGMFLQWEISHTYDENGNPVNDNEKMYSPSTGELVLSSDIQYNYNTSYAISEAITPDDLVFCLYIRNQMVNIPESRIIRGLGDDGNWYNAGKSEYYYTEIPSAVEEQENILSSVYPNPASDYINILIKNNQGSASFSLFDTQGRLIFRKGIVGQSKIPVVDLDAGLYIYIIEAEGKIQVEKIIKQ